MTTPPYGGPPPGEPDRPQQPWPPQAAPQPWGAQPGAGQPWGAQPAPGSPPYWLGESRHGQPSGAPTAPPRRSRRRLVAGIVVPAVLLLVAIGLARVFADTVLDTGRVEDDVAAQFQERHGVALDLSCDDEMQVEQGAEYECTGTTADDEEVVLRIVITDEATAAYTWDEV